MKNTKNAILTFLLAASSLTASSQDIQTYNYNSPTDLTSLNVTSSDRTIHERIEAYLRSKFDELDMEGREKEELLHRITTAYRTWKWLDINLQRREWE